MYLAQYQTYSETKTPFEISEAELKAYNDKSFGVFKTVNDFNGRRIIANLAKVNAWYVEIDYPSGVTKQPIDTFIDGLLVPSKIVDTRNGYHIYFNAHQSDLNVEAYNKIQIRLKEHYGGDGNARDICRYLRVPGYYHCKDLDNKYLCTTVYESNATYRQKFMLYYLPLSSKELEVEIKARPLVNVSNTDDFNNWVSSQNQMTLLQVLSGTSLVCGDTFKFYRTSGNRFNTYTNGKPSAWFIDAQGRIGSSVDGGPTVIQFVAWYHAGGSGLNKEAQRRAYRELKQFFRG